MAKTATLSIRIEPKAKIRAEKIFAKLGISLSEAVNLFFHQCIIDRARPFQPRARRNDRRRMHRRQKFDVAAGPQKLDDFAPRLAFPDAHDCRSRGSVRPAQHGKPAEFARRLGCVVADAARENSTRAQHIEHDLGVPARSVEKNRSRAAAHAVRLLSP